MAIFNWHIESYTRGRATSQSDYIWRREHFNAQDDLVASGAGNLPSWAQEDPAHFFAAADKYERKNGSAGRHLVVSLPRELALPQWVQLVEALVRKDLGSKPYQYAIHNKGNEDEEHPHAHILYSDRVPDGIDRPADQFFRRANPQDPMSGGCRKDSGGQSPKRLTISLVQRKKLWAELQNEALEAAGSSERVDHQPPRGRSKKDLKQ